MLYFENADALIWLVDSNDEDELYAPLCDEEVLVKRRQKAKEKHINSEKYDVKLQTYGYSHFHGEKTV